MTEREALQQCVEALAELFRTHDAALHECIDAWNRSAEQLAWKKTRAALAAARQALAEQPGGYPPLPRWSNEDATALAHRAGFSGTSWTMGPEELAHTLSLIAAPSEAAPAGWKLVPVEPTQEMLLEGGWSDIGEDEAGAEVWRQMLAAVPTPPAQTAEPKGVQIDHGHTDHPSRHWDRACPACNPAVLAAHPSDKEPR